MLKHSFFFVLLFALPLSVAAQDMGGDALPPYEYPLRGRHALVINAGLLNWSTVETDVSAGSTTSDVRTNGFVGSLAYTYWVSHEWAVGVIAGVLDTGTSTSVGAGGVTSESATVVPLLFGATYYPRALAIRPTLRPYVSGAAGPYLGTATNSRVGAVVAGESVAEAAFGLRLVAGADWFLSRHFKLGLGAGYHFVTDFDEPIGADTNYSGPEFSIGLGFVFGRGR